MPATSPLTKYLLLLLALSCVPNAQAQTTHMVTVGDNFFSPAELTIQPGDTVRWTNAGGGNPHNVTSRTNAWAASVTASSFIFEVTFDDPGEFEYFCTVHPVSMQGTITVGAGMAAAELDLLSVSLDGGVFEPGGAIDIRTRVRNSGDAEADGWSVGLYVSTDDSIGAGDILLGEFQGGTLQPGTTDNRVTAVDLPANLGPGTFYIGAIVTFEDADAGNNVNLDPVGRTILAFFINPGLNDAWFNGDTPGQGFLIIVLEDAGIVFLAWFTFDTDRPPEDVAALLGEPGHRWLTAQGPYLGNTAVLDLFLTAGGVFDMADPPAVTDPDPIGAITIVWEDCETGTLVYSIPALGLEGEMAIRRITPDNVPLCEELNDALQPG